MYWKHLFVLCVLFLISCTNHEVEMLLDQVESSMNEKPREAYSLLDSPDGESSPSPSINIELLLGQRPPISLRINNSVKICLFTVFMSKYGIFNHFTIEEVDGAIGVCGIVLAVGYHHDGGAFGVELREQFHDFQTVL